MVRGQGTAPSGPNVEVRSFAWLRLCAARYLDVLAQLEKQPWLFRNVVALSTAEFDALFA